MYNIAVIPMDRIRDAWPLAEPFLMKVVAVAPSELTLEGIQGRVLAGEEHLILVMSDEMKVVAAFTVGIQEFDTGVKSLSIPVIGGESLPEWLPDVTEQIKALAIAMGCQQVRAYGCRPGWLKVFQQYGATDDGRRTLRMQL